MLFHTLNGMKTEKNYKRKEVIMYDSIRNTKINCKTMVQSKYLMKLAGVGRNNALVIKINIKKKLESENYYVPNNAVPMQEVVKYLNIDIPYLEARANQIKEV